MEQELIIPVALEFSAGQINGLSGLINILSITEAHTGKQQIQEEIRSQYFDSSAKQRSNSDERIKQQNTRSYNLLLGMTKYGLLNSTDYKCTELGRTLLYESNEDTLPSIFAKHIISECHGNSVINAIRNLQSRSVRVTKTSLAGELANLGFVLPKATTNHTKLVRWLKECRVIVNQYDIDELVFAQLMGSPLSYLEDWGDLTREQQSFLASMKQLSVISSTDFVASADILKLSTVQDGAVYKRPDQLNADIFRPLEEKGWVERAPQTVGRGGKSPRLRATSKLLDIDTVLLPDVTNALPEDTTAWLKQSMSEIFARLESSDTYVKGIALEALAGKLAISLGLTPVEFRLRGSRTGGAEVDLIAEGAHLQFSRWLFQCKNTPGHRTDLADLAKEIGMAVLLKAQVVVMVSTGGFSNALQEYADELARSTALQVVLADRKMLDVLREGDVTDLLNQFSNQAKQTMELKRGQIKSSSD